jgi:hypothetical protein
LLSCAASTQGWPLYRRVTARTSRRNRVVRRRRWCRRQSYHYRESRSSRINDALSEKDRPPRQRFHFPDNRRASLMVGVCAPRSRIALTSCWSERHRGGLAPSDAGWSSGRDPARGSRTSGLSPGVCGRVVRARLPKRSAQVTARRSRSVDHPRRIGRGCDLVAIRALAPPFRARGH